MRLPSWKALFSRRLHLRLKWKAAQLQVGLAWASVPRCLHQLRCAGTLVPRLEPPGCLPARGPPDLRTQGLPAMAPRLRLRRALQLQVKALWICLVLGQLPGVLRRCWQLQIRLPQLWLRALLPKVNALPERPLPRFPCGLSQP